MKGESHHLNRTKHSWSCMDGLRQSMVASRLREVGMHLESRTADRESNGKIAFHDLLPTDWKRVLTGSSRFKIRGMSWNWNEPNPVQRTGFCYGRRLSQRSCRCRPCPWLCVSVLQFIFHNPISSPSICCRPWPWPSRRSDKSSCWLPLCFKLFIFARTHHHEQLFHYPSLVQIFE